MPKKEGFRILDGQRTALSEDKAKNAAGRFPHNVIRKKLADISNQPPQSRGIQEKSQSTESTTKAYINQLQKENMALVKMVAQRNEIIEHNGTELDRLRVHLLKMQEQNQQLALSNNEMLLVLNSDKDRLKMLEHELGWKTGLLKARNLNLERRARTTPLVDADAELIKSQEETESSKEGIDDEKTHKTENKRPYLRRQSARFEAAEVTPDNDLFDTNKSRVCASQLPEDTVGKQVSSSESASIRNESSTDGSGPGFESQQFGRSSLVRPSRAAAKKVQSYKEMPINVKLRRPE